MILHARGIRIEVNKETTKIETVISIIQSEGSI